MLMTSSARNISLCLWTRTALLEANKLAKEIINFFPCKFFSSCQFAIQTYELSINWVNLCKFVASFPSIFAVSCTPHLLQKSKDPEMSNIMKENDGWYLFLTCWTSLEATCTFSVCLADFFNFLSTTSSSSVETTSQCKSRAMIFKPIQGRVV